MAKYPDKYQLKEAIPEAPRPYPTEITHRVGHRNQVIKYYIIQGPNNVI